MAQHKIPSQEGIRQVNLNDTLGELWSTRNIDLHTNPGKLKLARPMVEIANDADLDGNFVKAIVVHEGVVKVLTNDALFKFAPDLSSIEEDTSSPASADDAVIFQGQVVISDNSNVDAWDGSSYTTNWWTARGNPSLDNNEHIMEVARIGAETLLVADGNKVHAYTGGIGSGAVLSVTVDLPETFKVTCMKVGIRRAFIGTYSEDADQAYVFEWDIASTNYTQAFPVGAKAVLSMEMVDNSPMIITERGEIKLFNNAGFTTIAQFPFATKPLFDESVVTGLIQSNSIARSIHSKGMKRAGNTVFIYTNFELVDTDLPMDERTPNGVWALNLSNYSLSHLCAPNDDLVQTRTSPIEVINSQYGRIYVGYTQQVSNDVSVFVEDLNPSSTNTGYAVTTEIESSSVADTYKEIISKHLLGEDDVIKYKYRTSNVMEYPLSFEGTWAQENIINTTEDLSFAKQRFDEGHFDEVEILTNSTGSIVGQITNIYASGSTYEVTLDTNCGIIGDISKAQIDNWSLSPVSATQTDGERKRIGIEGTSSWVQVKEVLSGKNGYPEIRQTIINTSSKEEI